MRVRFENFNFSYGQKRIIHNLSFSLESGDFLTIVGRNGTGKSTIIKCILKTLKIPNNMIFLDDVDINNIRTFSNIGYIPQKNEFNFEFPITVKEILISAYKGRLYDQYFKEVISMLDLNSLYNENINNLSGGQIQRIFIARALLTKPKLLVLDEPTVGVDHDNLIAMHEIFEHLKKKKTTIILITHDFDFCKDLADYRLSLTDSNTHEFISLRGNNDDNK